ncbi:hypothetical protein [Aestuariivivens insulae]|uniref:hypothetical protein n=1 Tax=Aestuariivivens insulae TaxID=1621988 RepID=UPI001F59E689|nr:hypothetical protein [Aestuariivivens insulae]
MGSTVKAICKCGYEKESSVGGGMLNYRTVQYFPCYCTNCKDLVEGNLKAEPLVCPDCNSRKVIPYNNKKLIGKKGKNEIVQSFDNILTDGYYRCPSCDSFNLQFKIGAILWD